LDKFKEAFDKTLKGGEGFSVAANNCIGSCMVQFDEACTGNKKISLFCLLVSNKLKLKVKFGKGKLRIWINKKWIVYND